MRFVAVLALHVHFQMQAVFADSRYIAVALQTILALGLHFARCMRLVAFIAIELHRRIIAVLDLDGLLDGLLIRLEESHIHRSVRNQLLADAIIIAVAEETFLPAGPDVRGAVGMTVDAGKAAHAYTMHLLAGMALQTKLFRREEVMQPALVRLDLTMTLGAFDLFHIHMPGMEHGLVDFFSRPLCMTFVAYFLTNDNLSMPGRDSVRPVEHKTDEQLVLLGDGEMMTFMTIQFFVFALRPAVVCRLHQMTADAKLRVVLGEIIKLVRNKTTADYNEKDEH